MEACCKKLEDWQLHPDALISHTFPLSEAETAYKVGSYAYVSRHRLEQFMSLDVRRRKGQQGRYCV